MWRRDGLGEYKHISRVVKKKKPHSHKGRIYTIVAIENIQDKVRGSRGSIKHITQERVL